MTGSQLEMKFNFHVFLLCCSEFTPYRLWICLLHLLFEGIVVVWWQHTWYPIFLLLLVQSQPNLSLLLSGVVLNWIPSRSAPNPFQLFFKNELYDSIRANYIWSSSRSTNVFHSFESSDGRDASCLSGPACSNRGSSHQSRRSCETNTNFYPATIYW